MKILHTVQSYYPSKGGMQEVVKQLSERLVELGHEVTVATSYDKLREEKTINGVTIKSFNVTGNAVTGMKGEIDAYQHFLLNNEFDIVTNFAAQQWATDVALPILKKIRAKKIFVPTGFSMLYNNEYNDYYNEMKNWMKEYDRTIFLSNDYRDINFARENGINKNSIIPNGASKNEFLSNSSINIREKLNIDKNAFLILHVGSYTGIKGHAEACQLFFRSKIKNAVLLLVGNNTSLFKKRYWYKVTLPLLFKNLTKKDKKLIISDSLTREETVAAYQAANLFLFPSNIECSPIVLFECMASKTPFLTTDVGNAKEIIEWSNGGALLPTSFDEKGYSHTIMNTSIKLLEELFSNETKRNHFSESGFLAWKNNFTWELITKKYEDLYKDALK